MKVCNRLWKDDKCKTQSCRCAFFMSDVLMIEECDVFQNCTIVITSHSSFTINEKFDLFKVEWEEYKNKEKIGIE